MRCGLHVASHVQLLVASVTVLMCCSRASRVPASHPRGKGVGEYAPARTNTRILSTYVHTTSTYQQLQPLQRCNPVENPIQNKALPSRNPDVLRLGEEIGSVVMGQSSGTNTLRHQPRKKNEADKPTSVTATQKLRAARLSGERKGWAFDHIGHGTHMI